MAIEDRASRRALPAIGITFAINGAVFGSWAPHVALVQERLAISPATLGLALLVMAVGALLAMPFAGRLCSRFGSAVVTRVSTLMMWLCLPFAALSASLWQLLPALFYIGAVSGTMDVSMNAHGVLVEGVRKKPVMSMLHGLFSLGALTGAGSAAVLLPLLGPVLHVWLVALAVLLCGLAVVPFYLPTSLDRGRPAGGLALPRGATLLIGALTFLALMAEGAVLDWSSIFLKTELGAGTSLAAAAFAVFSAAMTIGRLSGDRVRAVLSAVTVLRVSGALGAVGLALGLLSGNALATVAGLFCLGLGLANMVPILFVAAARSRPDNPGEGIAAVATLGYTGFLVGPPFMGFIAEAASVGAAFWVLVAASAIVALAAGATRRP